MFNLVSAISDEELRTVVALVEQGRSVPAVVARALLARLDAAESRCRQLQTAGEHA